MDQSCEHYDWNQLEREVVRPGVERVGFGSDKVMCVMNWLAPGMDTFPHKHPFEQLVLILQGRARFYIGDEMVEAGPGSMIRIPPDVMHYAEPVGEEIVLNLDVFAPPRDDYAHLVNYQNGQSASPRPAGAAQHLA